LPDSQLIHGRTRSGRERGLCEMNVDVPFVRAIE